MPEKHIGFEVRTLSNLINRRINQMISEEEDSLTAHQTWILNYLVSNSDRDIMQRDIEKHFSVRRSTTSHMLQLMENNGYITRISASDDARMKRIVITSKGTEAQARMADRLNRFENLLQDNLSKEDLAALSRLLQQMADNIR